VYTRPRSLPPSRIVDATLRHAIICDGSLVQAGSTIERSVVGIRAVIGKNVVLRDSVLIGADHYETDDERWENEQRGRPNLTIGDDTVIERAILDKECRIGRNVRIVNAQGVPEMETETYVIRDGIVVIRRAATIPDGTVI
jgi:glucose-1-phosphate adenylyltransferase